MSEPHRLELDVARLRASMTLPNRPATPDDELAAARAGGHDAGRAARWAQVCPSRFLRAQEVDLGADLEDETPDDRQARREAHRTLVRWIGDPAPPNLVILGPVGSGKTHAALAACRPAHDRYLAVRFLPVVEMLDQLRPGGPDGALEDLMGVDRLIIDDVGTEKVTDWTAERTYALINRRWLEERPTIATTNLQPGALGSAIGERTYSRLLGGATTIRLRGRDRRRTT